MGEGDLSRLFDRLETMERKAADRHLEIKLEVQGMKIGFDTLQVGLAGHQEELANLDEWRQKCELREAHSKGKIAAYMGAGAFIVFLADRLGIWDMLKATFN